MPCNSDYMAPSYLERELSVVACLLDEIGGKAWSRDHYTGGTHPRVYNRASRELGDALVSELCAALHGRDVTGYSLEMQIWWRDHQKADKERIEMELDKARTEKERQKAIEKLTPYERELLGLE